MCGDILLFMRNLFFHLGTHKLNMFKTSWITIAFRFRREKKTHTYEK